MFDFRSLLHSEREEAMPTVPATPPVVDDVYLTADEVSVRWRLSIQTLANLRSKGEGPPFTKLPSGSIRYKLSDILEAEEDGQYGFTWDALSSALKTFDGLSANQRASLLQHLKRTMN